MLNDNKIVEVTKQRNSIIFNLLPTICTVLNLSFGVLALICALQAHYKLSFVFIMFSGVLDVLDGFLARVLNASSDFGKQLDSLADLISFGVVPIVLVLLIHFAQLSFIGVSVCLMFIVCGVLRLARFNISQKSTTFTGLPIPVAGLLIAGLALLTETSNSGPILLLLVALSALMVSRLPFPSWKIVTIRIKEITKTWK